MYTTTYIPVVIYYQKYVYYNIYSGSYLSSEMCILQHIRNMYTTTYILVVIYHQKYVYYNIYSGSYLSSEICILQHIFW